MSLLLLNVNRAVVLMGSRGTFELQTHRHFVSFIFKVLNLGEMFDSDLPTSNALRRILSESKSILHSQLRSTRSGVKTDSAQLIEPIHAQPIKAAQKLNVSEIGVFYEVVAELLLRKNLSFEITRSTFLSPGSRDPLPLPCFPNVS